MRNRRWLDILWEVQPPSEDVLGWMDWATGILYLNHAVEDPEDFMRMLEAKHRSESDKDLLSTLTHENVHFLQVVTTGYMYRWVGELYRLLVRAMKPFAPEVPAYLDNPDPAFLLKIQNRISDVDRQDLQSTLARLDAAGPNGVTVRTLLECHAFLIEKMSHWQGLDADGYLHMLDQEASGPEYRLAYDLARFRLGDGAAFAYFSLIASLSLCDEDPPRAFDVLIGEMATWPLSQKPEAIDSDFAGRVSALLPTPLGSAAEATEQIPTQHPFYGAAVFAINQSCSGGFNVLKFFTDPVGEMEIILPSALRPMVFRANSKEQFGIIMPPGFDRKLMEPLLLYSVFSSRVLGSASASIARLQEGASGYEWLAHITPVPVQLDIEPDRLQRCDLGDLATMGVSGDADDANLVALLGRCIITFDIASEAPVWVEEDVRRYMQSLERVNPAFPGFLWMQPAHGMFLVWFASLAERSALHKNDTTLDLQHDSVVSYLIRGISAIKNMMETAGYAPRPVIQSVLTSYPREMQEKLLQELLTS
jgi:hypothetical protein